MISTMSIEDEIKAIATDVAHLRAAGRLADSPADASIHRQLEGIWDGLLIVARAIDSDRRRAARTP